MRHGVRCPAWHLLLVAVLTEALGLELCRPPSDSSTGQPPKSPVVQWISISWSVTATPCGVRSSPRPVAVPRLTGFRSIRTGIQAVMARRQPESTPG
jgi:hypothetical protein